MTESVVFVAVVLTAEERLPEAYRGVPKGARNRILERLGFLSA